MVRILLMLTLVCNVLSAHSDNWAVIVDTSVFWFNYRHIANTLSFYHTVKDLGIPDSNIILMLAEDIPCNSRNYHKSELFASSKKDQNLYDETVEVDYRGDDVSVENLLRVLTGRHEPGTPDRKKLHSTAKSNIMVYLTGHGGDEFLKFRDREELTSQNLADAFRQMAAKSRYNEIVFMTDTCQANTMFAQIDAPGILAIGSSAKGENSYSHHAETRELGVAVIDRFSYHSLKHLQKIKHLIKAEKQDSRASMQSFLSSFDFHALRSHVGWNSTLSKSLETTYMHEFFAAKKRQKLDITNFDLDKWIS